MLIQFTVLLAFAAYFTIAIVRKLPLVRGWVEKGIRPWACDLCMSLWTTCAWVGALYALGWGYDTLASAAGGGGCLSLLRVTAISPPPAPPSFDDDE